MAILIPRRIRRDEHGSFMTHTRFTLRHSVSSGLSPFPHRTFIVCTTSSVVVWFTGTENIALHTVKLCTSVSQYFYMNLRGAQGNARPQDLVCARFL